MMNTTTNTTDLWTARLTELARALEQPDPHLPDDPSPADLGRALSAVVDLARADEVWLALAVMTSALPNDLTVRRTVRRCALEGPTALGQIVRDSTVDQGLPVRVVAGQTLVDIQNSLHTPLATGIQRVTRETAARWTTWHRCVMTTWTDGFLAMRSLMTSEARQITSLAEVQDEAAVVVPWHSVVLLPELALDLARTTRYQAITRRSNNRVSVIGYDCVPITSAETAIYGLTAGFANNLAAVSHADRIVAISDAAATEYCGWRRMLTAAGISGPEIVSVPLPEVVPAAGSDDLAAARRRFLVGTLPMVLVVGSHEPRKNHLAVLHAAEQLWRSGHRFSLSFISGNSWHNVPFFERLAELQAQGRPFESTAKIPDPILSAAYRLARFTVFPSFNEGFGLPVVESLAVGTPVVASGFGSMAEIAAGGGVLPVDPRDDADIERTMGRLLTDDNLLARLRAEARRRPARTWDDYARETWEQMNPWHVEDQAVLAGAQAEG